MYVLGIGVIGFCFSEPFRFNLNFPYQGNGYSYTRFKEADTLQHADIVFLGSSHTYRGFDTRIFDSTLQIKSFNLGSSSQSPIQTRILIEEFVQKIKPKLVIYEVCPSDLSSDGIESSLDFISNRPLEWNSVQLCFETLNFKTLNALIFKFWHQIFNQPNPENLVRKNDQYVQGGYVERNLNYYEDGNESMQRETILKHQFETLLDNLDLLQSLNCEVLLVQAPYVKKSFLNEFTESDLNRIQEKALFLNYSDSLELDTSSFYDPQHLNQKGVQIFNQALCSYLSTKRAANKVSPLISEH
jgi:hypothetical protein